MAEVLFSHNDHTIKLLGLKDGKTGNFVNNATVEATIYNSRGEPLAGVTWPIPMSYVADSDGDYQGDLDEEFVASLGSGYYMITDASAAPDVKGRWRTPIRVENRE